MSVYQKYIQKSIIYNRKNIFLKDKFSNHNQEVQKLNFLINIKNIIKVIGKDMCNNKR